MINIFTSATNNYKYFIKDFYESFNKNFITEDEKFFYIFCDDLNHEIFKNENVKGIFISHEIWPYITLNRYKNIKPLLDNLKTNTDMCFYIDIDMEIKKPISNINLKENKKFIGVIHPSNIDSCMNSSLEDNIKSQAFLDITTIKPHNIYIQGCLWGASLQNFKYMINELYDMVITDTNNNIIPKWHDESYLNKFKILNKQYFSYLNSSFCYPENWKLPIGYEKIIIHKEKNYKEYPRHQGA
jgi:hypothetical protein